MEMLFALFPLHCPQPIAERKLATALNCDNYTELEGCMRMMGLSCQAVDMAMSGELTA